MKAGRLLSVVVAACAAVGLIAPQFASAGPGSFIFPAGRESQLTARGTRGFQITIDRTAGRVELYASKGSTSAIYIVHATKSKTDGIEATFPARGKVLVRFHPRGRAQRSPGECGGRASVKQAGIFSAQSGSMASKDSHGSPSDMPAASSTNTLNNPAKGRRAWPVHRHDRSERASRIGWRNHHLHSNQTY